MIATLKDRWSEGKTASEIAAELTLAGDLSFGRGEVTRNMVIGKAHRLGLPARPSPIVRTP